MKSIFKLFSLCYFDNIFLTDLFPSSQRPVNSRSYLLNFQMAFNLAHYYFDVEILVKILTYARNYK